ncbi:L-ascorbate metabolism protein UlaG (beta-lactamase superfamily) [Methanohalophilus euhalobius]|jgi:L-ascorbate metabolism protein UlaG (beta-lactamase superfamily)|uniref:L-ascorbate metabolism protein UlaG (Beta-lactamase superfamily) n=2 Tax=Methanohalophilus euhalobius TaxID=51203 RepID=A0A285EN91_9EURY|nr:MULTISPECIES: MBL fold metallo-hydrolase [Methanohalophilus]RSD35398.1 MAG: outer membrane protein expression inhibitor [Methanohalophilus sp.]ODV49408.1 MAG: outer membrane protein expression inhibitor [Methanohalophilus sp. 2-GBenrich]RXG35202.1 outer membrane protein expression inhibitor [Methanohalophilus sp. WG1-DM]TCL11171.1 L-ascorbate metabolism protein UlaG (beta-lactamase superfamily) [Methanohalophilus euhalobius]SNY00447.1 L-ascorbate metabolism protein UlaG, beta-lactamase supe
MVKLKKIALHSFLFFILFCVGIIVFMNVNPAFGGDPTTEQKETYQHLSNYVDGHFVNELPTSVFGDPSDTLPANNSSVSEFADRDPASPIPVYTIDWEQIKSKNDSLTWLGHSAFLLNIDGKKLLLDPMLSPVASPVSFVGINRYEYSEDIMLDIIDEMTPIDAVLISHDHYDHLDYQSIVKLNSKVSHFFVPLGCSAHLIKWGIPEEKITELNWWEETKYQDLTVALTPSRHGSGRDPFSIDTTLWGGWVILGNKSRIYTSGDGGYGPHFKEIGNKYGPFDITLIEGAQYDQRWAEIHMLPEQAVQANLDVNGETMMLMHWGAFTLANHAWDKPIERALEEANERDMNIIAPMIGETVLLDSDLQMPSTSWWDF